LHTVNPQLAITRRFAVRNKCLSLAEGRQTAYATVNSRRNESSAGLRVPGFQGKGMILHCKMILAELVVGLDSKGGKAKMDFESATRQGRSDQKG
jgi:hypothetical protein